VKYLVAYKPCGCAVAYTTENPLDPVYGIGFRVLYERKGAVVREVEADRVEVPGDCQHGSLSAQLNANLAGLREFVTSELANLPATKEWDQYKEGRLDGIESALRSVLAMLEGKS
jgi:hypothetical protein